MKTFIKITLWVGIFRIFACHVLAEDKQAGGWSADLLSQILKADAPKPTANQGAAPEAAPAAKTAAPGEMILRTYRLTHMHVGEAGKPQMMLTSLQQLLPPGSQINPDVNENSLHVFTTPAAHQHFHDIVSALDVPEQKSPLAAPAMPDDMKAMLTKLAETGDQSGKLAAAIGAVKSDVAHQIAEIDARQRQHTLRLVIGGIVVAIVLTITIAWMMRRRTSAEALARPVESTALTLPPEQLTTALMPLHERTRNDMLGVLNEVAIKLQAQHNEQQAIVRQQQQELVEARRAMENQTSQVAAAVERVDATAQKLAKQQDKVADLVEELQGTLKELDATKDRLDATKDELTKKEIELEQERSKIAALSILLEEGNLPPPGGLMPPNLGSGSSEDESATPDAGETEPTQINGSDAEPSLVTAPTPQCTPDQTTPSGSRRTAVLAAPPPPRFQFLPPDHPEN